MCDIVPNENIILWQIFPSFCSSIHSCVTSFVHSFIQHWTQYKLQSMSFRNATTINTRPHWLFWQIFEDKSKHTKFDCSFSISLHGVKEQNSTSSYLYFVRAGESIWNVVGLEGRMFYSVSPFKQVVLVRFPQKSCIFNIFSTFCLCNCLTKYPKEASLKIKSIDYPTLEVNGNKKKSLQRC